VAPSHPPTLLTLAARALEHELRLPRGSRVLVAVSGGADSMALLHALARLAPRFGLELCAHGVDHGLRPEAAAELDLAEQLARDLGVPFGRTELGMKPSGNLQARARAGRHAALKAEAARVGAGVVATGHHADDRAETVLLRLLRGTSPRGLAVLPPRAGHLVRPLLRATRRDISAHLSRHGVPHREDPSNSDPRFLRVRVRHELLPLLATLSPGIVQHLNTLADEVALAAPLPHRASDGSELSLGRAQRAALRRLLEDHSLGGSIWIEGGRELSVDRGTGALQLSPFSPPSPSPRKRGRPPRAPR